jgi:hypothetical protein
MESLQPLPLESFTAGNVPCGRDALGSLKEVVRQADHYADFTVIARRRRKP